MSSKVLALWSSLFLHCLISVFIHHNFDLEKSLPERVSVHLKCLVSTIYLLHKPLLNMQLKID